MRNDRDPNIMERADVIRWRKAERERLIAVRLATSADDRAAWAAEIAKGLDRVIGDVTGLIVNVYWPFRGEPDLRAWMKQVTARGGRCALPVVVEKGQPLIFRCWADGEPLERGVWNIPIPAAGPSVVPDVADRAGRGVRPAMLSPRIWRRVLRQDARITTESRVSSVLDMSSRQYTRSIRFHMTFR